MKRYVKVKCKIGDIPEVFEQDISNLAMNSIVYTKDLVFPNGTILTPPQTALFGVTSIHKIEELEQEAKVEEPSEKASEETGAADSKEGADSKGTADSKDAKDAKKETKEAKKPGEKTKKSKQ